MGYYGKCHFKYIYIYIDKHSWIYMVLDYNHQHNISINAQHQVIQGQRTNDVAIMTAASFLYQHASTLKSINRVRQRHKCHSLSEIYSADGNEIDTRYTIKLYCKATRNNHDWPIKSHITVNNYRVWKKFLLCLCKDETLILTDPLGQWKYYSITE